MPTRAQAWSVLWGMRVFVKSTQTHRAVVKSTIKHNQVVEGGKNCLDATSLSSGLVCFTAAAAVNKLENLP